MKKEKYICVVGCQWGPNGQSYRTWEVGEIYNGIPKNQDGSINHHFRDMNAELDGSEPDLHAIDNLENKAINDALGLGYNKQEVFIMPHSIFVDKMVKKVKAEKKKAVKVKKARLVKLAKVKKEKADKKVK